MSENDFRQVKEEGLVNINDMVLAHPKCISYKNSPNYALVQYDTEDGWGEEEKRISRCLARSQFKYS